MDSNRYYEALAVTLIQNLNRIIRSHQSRLPERNIPSLLDVNFDQFQEQHHHRYPQHWSSHSNYRGPQHNYSQSESSFFNPRDFRERDFRRDPQRMLMYPQKDETPRRKRRCHLEDIFRNNYDESDEEYFEEANHQRDLHNWNRVRYKKSEYISKQRSDHPHNKKFNGDSSNRSSGKTPKINIKLNLKPRHITVSSCKIKKDSSRDLNDLKYNGSTLETEVRSSEEILPQKQSEDLIDGTLPKKLPEQAILTTNENSFKKEDDLVELTEKSQEFVKENSDLTLDRFDENTQEMFSNNGETLSSSNNDSKQDSSDSTNSLKVIFDIPTQEILIDLTDEINHLEEEFTKVNAEKNLSQESELSTDSRIDVAKISNVNERTSKTLSDDVYEALTQKIETNIIQEISMSTQELLDELTDNTSPLPDNIPNPKISGNVKDSNDDQKNNKIEIPFLENVIDTTNTFTTFDGLTFLDDHTIVDMDIGTPSPKRKSVIELRQTPEKKKKICDFPEINSDDLLLEIDQIVSLSDENNKNKYSDTEDQITIRKTLSNPLIQRPIITPSTSNESNKHLLDVLEGSVDCDKFLMEFYTNDEKRHDRKEEIVTEFSDRQNCFSKQPFLKLVSSLNDLFGEDDDDNEKIVKDASTQRSMKSLIQKGTYESASSTVVSNAEPNSSTCTESMKMVKQCAMNQRRLFKVSSSNEAASKNKKLAQFQRQSKHLVCKESKKSPKKVSNKHNIKSISNKNYSKRKRAFKDDSNSNDTHSNKHCKIPVKVDDSESDAGLGEEASPLSSPVINFASENHFSLDIFECSELLQLSIKCRARVEFSLNEHCDEAVTLDKPEIQEVVEIIPIVDTFDDVVEIKPYIPEIDLTGESSDTEIDRVVDSKQELLAILKEETQEGAITLYRSDETVNNSLEVQAQSAVLCSQNNTLLSNETSETKNEVNIDEVKTDNNITIVQQIEPQNSNRDSECGADSRLKVSESQNETSLRENRPDEVIETVVQEIEKEKDNASVTEVSSIDQENPKENYTVHEQISILPNVEQDPKEIDNTYVEKSMNNTSPASSLSADTSPNTPVQDIVREAIRQDVASQTSNFTVPNSSAEVSMTNTSPIFSMRADTSVVSADTSPEISDASTIPPVQDIVQGVIDQAVASQTSNFALPTINTSINQENNPPVVIRRPSVERSERTTTPQTPRREIPEYATFNNTNISNEVYENRLCMEIKRILKRFMVFYLHLRRQQQIYINSMALLNNDYPDLVQLERNVNEADQMRKTHILATNLVMQLRAVCQNKNLEVDLTRWIDHLIRTFQPPASKSLLIFILHRFFNVHKDFYLGIPYLKKMFEYVMLNSTKLLEKVEQHSKSQNQQNHGPLPTTHQQLQQDMHVPAVREPPPPYPANSRSQNYAQNMNAHIEYSASAHHSNRQNVNAIPDKNFFTRSNSELLRGFLRENSTAIPSNSPSPPNTQTNVPLNNRNQPLNIISNVMLSPGSSSKPQVNNVPTANYFKIRLPLSEPHDTSNVPINKQANFHSMKTNLIQGSEGHYMPHSTNLLRTAIARSAAKNNAFNSSMIPNASDIQRDNSTNQASMNELQGSPHHVSEAYNAINSTNFSPTVSQIRYGAINMTKLTAPPHTSQAFRMTNPVKNTPLKQMAAMMESTNSAVLGSPYHISEAYTKPPSANPSKVAMKRSSTNIFGLQSNTSASVNSDGIQGTLIHTSGTYNVPNGSTNVNGLQQSPCYTSTASNTVVQRSTMISSGNMNGSSPYHASESYNLPHSSNTVRQNSTMHNLLNLNGAAHNMQNSTTTYPNNIQRPTMCNDANVHNRNSMTTVMGVQGYPYNSYLYPSTISANMNSADTYPYHTSEINNRQKCNTSNTIIQNSNVNAGTSYSSSGSPYHIGHQTGSTIESFVKKVSVNSPQSSSYGQSMGNSMNFISNAPTNQPNGQNIRNYKSTVFQFPSPGRQQMEVSPAHSLENGGTFIPSNIPRHPPTLVESLEQTARFSSAHTTGNDAISLSKSNVIPPQKNTPEQSVIQFPFNRQSISPKQLPLMRPNQSMSSTASATLIGASNWQSSRDFHMSPNYEVANPPISPASVTSNDGQSPASIRSNSHRTSQHETTPVSDSGSTPDQVVPPALRNIKSPVYAPMLLSPSNYLDDLEESEMSNISENNVIDLTWMDDIDPDQLQSEINEVFIKKEEPDDDVILNQEQFPVSDCHVLTFIDRRCICHKPAEYVCKCRIAMYCSEPCQLKDWKTHKNLCMKYRKKGSN